MAAVEDLDQVIEQYHQALDEFSRGNLDPVKNFYSRRDDVAIANPFFPLTRGREQVVERLERSVQKRPAHQKRAIARSLPRRASGGLFQGSQSRRAIHAGAPHEVYC